MAGTQVGRIIGHLRRVVRPESTGGQGDARLLERWTQARDEAAFEVLPWRHGPLVLHVCGRLLPRA
jgi:hypothetical protein